MSLVRSDTSLTLVFLKLSPSLTCFVKFTCCSLYSISPVEDNEIVGSVLDGKTKIVGFGNFFVFKVVLVTAVVEIIQQVRNVLVDDLLFSFVELREIWGDIQSTCRGLLEISRFGVSQYFYNFVNSNRY